MKLKYFYDEGLPSRNAAWIQIINTCRAMAELGLEVEIVAAKIEGDFEAFLATFDLAPHPNLKLITSSTDLFKNPFEGAQWVMSRDDRGLELFHRIQSLPGRSVPPYLIFEAHRVAFINRSEKGGRPSGLLSRVTGGGTLAAKLRRIVNRRVHSVRRKETRVVKSVDGIVALNSLVDKDLRHYFRHDKPTLILPSGATIHASSEQSSPRRDLDLVYAGKLLQRKGVADLVRAMEFLPGKRLALLGGDEEGRGDLQTLARRLDVQDRIEFLGSVEPREVSGYLSRARVGLCPASEGLSSISSRYTSPLKIVEYWAAGTPVVAAGTSAILEMVTPEKDALVYPPGNPQRLAHQIGRILEDQELAQRLAMEGALSAESRSWERRARRLKDFLESIPSSAVDSRTSGER